ncbi:MAG: pilus assembly protein N-terminal domain-containing protein [Pseudomonadota bacterium]
MPTILRADQQTIRINSSDGTVITMAQDVATVIVADPAVADVQILSDRTVFLFGKAPGATRLFVLNAEDEVIVNRRLVITPSLAQIDRTFSPSPPPAS